MLRLDGQQFSFYKPQFGGNRYWLHLKHTQLET
jgi:hypothetical protein